MPWLMAAGCVWAWRARWARLIHPAVFLKLVADGVRLQTGWDEHWSLPRCP